MKHIAKAATANSTPKITLSKQVRLWSLPDTLRVRINPGEAVVKGVTFGLRAGAGKITYKSISGTLKANTENVVSLPTAAWTDAASMASYPITLNSVQLTMGTSTTGKAYQVQIPGIETVYTAVPVSGIDAVGADAAFTVTATGTQLNFGSVVDSADAYDLTGRLVATANGVSSLCLPARGAYVVTVKAGSSTVTRKVVL